MENMSDSEESLPCEDESADEDGGMEPALVFGPGDQGQGRAQGRGRGVGAAGGTRGVIAELLADVEVVADAKVVVDTEVVAGAKVMAGTES